MVDKKISERGKGIQCNQGILIRKQDLANSKPKVPIADKWCTI